MNQASNIKVILPTLKADKGFTGLQRFCRDFDDKVAGLQHGEPLVKLKNHLAGRPDHNATVAPSFLSVPGLNRSAPGEQIAKAAEPDAGSMASPKSKISSTSSTSQVSEAGTFYWQLSAESKDLDEYLFGQLQSAVEGAFKTHLDSVRNRSYIEGMLILHNIERLSRVMDLMGMWDKFVDISVTGDVTEWYTSVLASWNDFNSRRITPEIFFLLQVYKQIKPVLESWRYQSYPQYSMTLSRTTLRSMSQMYCWNFRRY